MVIIVMLGRHGKEALLRAIDAFAPKIEPPISKCTIVLVDIGVLDNNGPSANSRFTPLSTLVSKARIHHQSLDLPMHYRHESPIHIAPRVIVQVSCCAQIAHYVLWAPKLDAEISSSSVRDVHGDCDML